MSLFLSGKTMILAGGLATLALTFQLGVFYGPERRDALYREYSGAGRVAAVAAWRPTIARLAQTAFPQAQAAGFVEAPSPGSEVPGEYGRPLIVAEREVCDGAAGAILARGMPTPAEPAAAPFKPNGSLYALFGNLAPEGSVVKVSGATRRVHRGPARVFDSEEACADAVRAARRWGSPDRWPSI